MPKRVPIKAAKDVGREHGLTQVILLGWDGERTHVVTWGNTVEACDQAAQGGDRVKKALNWPDDLLGDEPHRVRKLKARIVELEKQLQEKENER